ncbi:MAG TPA: hypothetical protein GXZ82_15510 [Firmicutes bacterium]|nr:hypothetical protein [Bacillota bacterium]
MTSLLSKKAPGTSPENWFNEDEHTALSGYAALQYYRMTSRAVLSGLIALIATAIYDGLNFYLAVLAIDLARRAYTLSRIAHGLSIDVNCIEQLVSPTFLLIALGISVALKGVGAGLVLVSRKHIPSESAASEAKESA